MNKDGAKNDGAQKDGAQNEETKTMTVNVLKSELRKLNLSQKGNKEELRQRLEQAKIRLEYDDDGHKITDDESDLENGDENEKSSDDEEDETTAYLQRTLAAVQKELEELKKKNKTKKEAKKTEEKKEVQCSERFNSKDVEDVVSTFSGSDNYNVKCWIEEFEQTAEMLKWSALQQFVFAKKLMRGAAKTFCRSASAEIKSFSDLKDQLLEEYDRKLSDIEAHKLMKKTKKKPEESINEYFTIMRELGANNNLDKASVIQYTIDGIDDSSVNKIILLGATDYKEFKMKLRAYESVTEADKSKKKDGKSWSKFQKNGQSNSNASGNSKQTDNRCYSCGEIGHLSLNCPKKSEGTKCFRCNKFGHKSRTCKENVGANGAHSKELMMTSQKAEKQKMRKTVTLMGKQHCALVDTVVR